MTGEHYDEGTLFKVRTGLLASGLSEMQVRDAIFGMQNEGILFRERGTDPDVPREIDGPAR